MAHITADRITETWNGTGTGAVALAGAVIGFRAFGAVMGEADTAIVTIRNLDEPSEWEIALATFNAGPNTLTRTVTLASSEGTAPVPFTPGPKAVALTPSAFDVPTLRGGGDFVATPSIGGAPIARLADVTAATVGLDLVANHPPASQAEAEAGTEAARVMSPLRTAQAIAAAALVPQSRVIATTAPVTGGGDLTGNRTLGVTLASKAQAEAGESNAALMTPLRTLEAIAALSGGGIGSLARDELDSGSIISVGWTNITFANLGSTPLEVTFDAPASGIVWVRFNAFFEITRSGTGQWDGDICTRLVTGSTTEITGSRRFMHTSGNATTSGVQLRRQGGYRFAELKFTGLTPAASYTWRVQGARFNGTSNPNFCGVRYGGNVGPATLEVFG